MQTNLSVPMACGKLEVSVNSCVSWTDISGSSGAVISTRQTRINDQFFAFDSDDVILAVGLPEPIPLAFRVVYSPTAGEAFEIARDVFDQATCGSQMCARWSPNGGNVGDQRFVTEEGELIRFVYPTMDANGGGPIMTSFVLLTGDVRGEIIT